MRFLCFFLEGMSGVELAEAIFQTSRIVPKPVVVGLTADTSMTMDTQCGRSGMQNVFHKPLTVNQLKEFFDNITDHTTTITQ
jgi:CheY-like chemotaxis protein